MKTYIVASRHVEVDKACHILSPFEIRSPSPDPVRRHRTAANESHGELVYQGSGWVAGSLHKVKCTLSERGYLLEISGVGIFWVAADGSSFRCLESDPGVDPAHLSHTTAGPPLVLALALQNAFCVHASAVTYGSHAIAFVGYSGSGKSSLARYLEDQPGLGWRRLADDTLAVEESAKCPTALPRFPQLKLGDEEQPWIGQPDKLPLSAIYLLGPPTGDPTQITGVSIQPESPRDAAVALMHHTVAARLFSPALVERHLDFCAGIAEQIPVSRLSYPWGLEAVPDISRALLSGHRP